MNNCIVYCVASPERKTVKIKIDVIESLIHSKTVMDESQGQCNSHLSKNNTEEENKCNERTKKSRKEWTMNALRYS